MLLPTNAGGITTATSEISLRPQLEQLHPPSTGRITTTQRGQRGC
jgi:hypothetical protein